MFGVGSKTRGGIGVTGDGIPLLCALASDVISGGGVIRFLRLVIDSWNGLSSASIVSSAGVNRRMALLQASDGPRSGEPGDGGCCGV